MELVPLRVYDNFKICDLSLIQNYLESFLLYLKSPSKSQNLFQHVQTENKL